MEVKKNIRKVLGWAYTASCYIAYCVLKDINNDK